MSNLQQRILSAIILAPLVLTLVYLGGMAYNALVAVACGLMLYEWQKMTKKAESHRCGWHLGGLIYIILPCVCLALLRQIDTPHDDTGLRLTFSLLVMVWGTDIGAYIAGRIIGGPKIAPKISPNKTWAGLFGGMILAAIATGALSHYYETPIIPHMILAAAIAIIAQTGDFFESWVKRRFGVKDSSNIIPGHGGLLDRLDGLLFAAPVVLAVWYLRQSL